MPNQSPTIAMMLESGGPGGAETVLILLSEELLSRGYQVLPVKINDGEQWMVEKLQDLGLETEVIEIRRGYDLGYLRQMTDFLRRRKVDVVHSHEFTKAVYGAAATKRLGIPHVISMHGNQTMMKKLRRRVALRWAFRHSRATVAVSEDTRRHLEERLGLPPGRVVTVPNGIPIRNGDATPVREELKIAPEEVVILCVGTLVPRKGHIVILEALSRLREGECEVPWRLVIAGRGPERERLESFAASHGMGGRVDLLGHRDDIPNLQTLADIFSMPSLWEGLPLAVLEAMFAGNAVIASATSGIPEAIRDGENGILVPPGEPEPLFEGLRRLLESDALRKQLGEAARKTAESNFTVSRMADRYEALYWGDHSSPRVMA